MKNIPIILVLVTLVLLAFFGCASQPAETDATTEETAEEKSPTTGKAEETAEKETKEPEMKKVVQEIQLVKKRLSYFSDGVLDDYREYIYAEEGTNLLEEGLYNSEDEAEEKKVYTYKENLRTKMEIFNEKGELRSVHQYTYDDNGNLVEDILYDGEEKIQTRQQYEYNSQGKKIKWSVYGGSGALLSYSEYTYENGLNTRIENFSPGGDLLDYFKIEYNGDGLPVKNTWFSADGDVEEIREFDYTAGGLSEEIIRRGNGSVKRKILYTNNEKGNPVEAIHKDGGEKVLETVVFEYTTREFETLVKVE